MKILVVGGTGLVGGHATLHLQSLGHEVTIAARHSAQEKSALASLPILIGDYVANDFKRAQLADFDAVVFAAGNDLRHIEKDSAEAAHWPCATIKGVPRIFLLRSRRTSHPPVQDRTF